MGLKVQIRLILRFLLSVFFSASVYYYGEESSSASFIFFGLKVLSEK